MATLELSTKELDAILMTLHHAEVTWMTSDLWAKLETAYNNAVNDDIDKQFHE